MSQELAGHICNFLVLHVILNSIIIELGFNISQFHVINADTIIGQSFSMDISDCSADLQEFLVLGDCIFEFTKVVI